MPLSALWPFQPLVISEVEKIFLPQRLNTENSSRRNVTFAGILNSSFIPSPLGLNAFGITIFTKAKIFAVSRITQPSAVSAVNIISCELATGAVVGVNVLSFRSDSTEVHV